MVCTAILLLVVSCDHQCDSQYPTVTESNRTYSDGQFSEQFKTGSYAELQTFVE